MSGLFIKLAEAFARVHGAPIPKEILYIGDRDEGWCVKFNNTGEVVEEQPPCTFLVYWNGFPGGVIHPRGGILLSDADLAHWLEMVQ